MFGQGVQFTNDEELTLLLILFVKTISDMSHYIRDETLYITRIGDIGINAQIVSKGYVKMTYECEDTGITIKVIDTGMGIQKKTAGKQDIRAIWRNWTILIKALD